MAAAADDVAITGALLPIASLVKEKALQQKDQMFSGYSNLSCLYFFFFFIMMRLRLLFAVGGCSFAGKFDSTIYLGLDSVNEILFKWKSDA